MANWVQCEGYTEDRTKIWINLDQVASITPHQNGSVLRFAMADAEGQLELVVWDRAENILPRARRR